MNQVNCPVCGNKCIKAGKTKAGSQRWLCRKCNSSVTHKIDNSAKELQIFLDWLFGKESQSSMPGDGRTFRRKTAKYWNIWPMPPKVEDSRDVLYLDGIYLGRKACILICCDDKYVLGWYLCRYEYAAAWTALMKRIAEPRMVVSDGGTGFAKALKKVWPGAKHQRCVFHVFCQVRRYTTWGAVPTLYPADSFGAVSNSSGKVILVNASLFTYFSYIIGNRHKNPFFQFYRYFLIVNYAK